MCRKLLLPFSCQKKKQCGLLALWFETQDPRPKVNFRSHFFDMKIADASSAPSFIAPETCDKKQGSKFHSSGVYNLDLALVCCICCCDF